MAKCSTNILRTRYGMYMHAGCSHNVEEEEEEGRRRKRRRYDKDRAIRDVLTRKDKARAPQAPPMAPAIMNSHKEGYLFHRTIQNDKLQR